MEERNVWKRVWVCVEEREGGWMRCVDQSEMSVSSGSVSVGQVDEQMGGGMPIGG